MRDKVRTRRSGWGRTSALLVAALGLWGAAPVHGEPPGATLLVDDFDQAAQRNRLGGNLGSWKSDPSDSSQWCEIGFASYTFVGGSGYSLKIDYNVASSKTHYFVSEGGPQGGRPASQVTPTESGFREEAYNGVYMTLNDSNVSAYKYLVFSMRGDPGNGFTKRLKLELKDQKRAQAVYIEGVTAQWQKFFVPLGQFRSTLDMKKLRDVVFVFEPRGGTRAQGTLYVDDMYFSKTRDQSFDPSQQPPTCAPKAAQLVVVNGDLGDWGSDESAELKSKNLLSGKLTNKKDLSGKVFFSWDAQYLYFAMDVTDNEIINRHRGKNMYRGDVVELYLDPEGKGFNWDPVKNFQLGFSPVITSDEPAVWSWTQNRALTDEEFNFAVRFNNQGYVIEAAIAWSFLGYQPHADAVLGAGVVLNDLDVDSTPNARLGWAFLKEEKADENKCTLGSLMLNRGPKE